MIISSEHRALIDEFEAANAAEGKATEAVGTYMRRPGFDMAMARQLMQAAEDAHSKKMDLFAKLKAVSLDSARTIA